MNRRIIVLFLAAALLLSACGGTVSTVPSEAHSLPEPTETEPLHTVPATTPQGTEPPGTEVTDPSPTETAASVTEPSEETEPVTTEPAETEPQPSEPTETEPQPSEPTVTAPTATEPAVTEPPVTEPPKVEELPEEAAIPNTITAVASGTKVKSNSLATIDYSNTKDGYVMVCFTAETDSKLKAQVKGPDTTYTYNLTPGQWSAFPLSDENGDYQICVYENVTGTKYALVISATITVSMSDEFAPFLRSNQYVNFDNAPNTVAKAAALTAGISDPLKKVEKIYDFVVGMTYDKELANTVQNGYTPNLDAVLAKMSGICFDYAALMTAMLRSQGVPAKLVIGYAGDAYHAWINVWSEQTGWVDGVIYFDGVNWKRMDPTFASSGGSDMLEYIGNGSNYTAKYFY